MVNFLWDRGRPRPLVAQKASGGKLAVLRTRAGEGARGPSKSGYQRPNLESKLTHYRVYGEDIEYRTEY